jgi:hypothetical protein
MGMSLRDDAVRNAAESTGRHLVMCLTETMKTEKSYRCCATKLNARN